MPMTRESSVPVMNTVAQLLSYLQIEGHLDGVQVPDWATGGKSVEELMLALRGVGDAEWLQPVYPNLGPAEAADKWILDFWRERKWPLRATEKAAGWASISPG